MTSRRSAPPDTGGISASSSPACSGWVSSAYSRLTAITTDVPCGELADGAQRVRDPGAVGQLERELARAGALPQSSEQANRDTHRTQGYVTTSGRNGAGYRMPRDR